MSQLPFWILMVVFMNTCSSISIPSSDPCACMNQISILAEDDGSEVSVTNEDCSADVVVQNENNFEVHLYAWGQPRLPQSRPLFADTKIPALGFLVVKMAVADFTDDYTVEFDFYNSNQKSTRYFDVKYSEILSGLNVSTGLPTTYAATGSTILINAWVDYGEYVVFDLSVDSDGPEETVTSSVSNDRRTKTAVMSYTLGDIPRTSYTIGVTATATPDTGSLQTSTVVISLQPLPPIELTLFPSYLRTSTGGIDVCAGELVNVSVAFNESFSTTDTGISNCDALGLYSRSSRITVTNLKEKTIENLIVFDVKSSLAAKGLYLHRFHCSINQNIECKVHFSFEMSQVLFYPVYDTDPPTANVANTYWELGILNETISCSTVVSTQSNHAQIIVRSITDFSRAALVHSVVPFNDDVGHTPVHVTVWNDYPGTAENTLSLAFALGNDDETEDSYSQTTKDAQEYTLIYYTRYVYEITVEFINQDAMTFDVNAITKIISLQVEVGIIGVTFDVGFTLVTNQNERMLYSILKKTKEELTLLVTYAPLDQESVGMDSLNDIAELSKLYTSPGMYRITIETTFIGRVEKYITREFEVQANPAAALINELFEIKYRAETFPLPARMSNIPTIAARSPVDGNQNYTLTFTWRLLKEINGNWDNIAIVQPNAINLVLQNFISFPGLYKIELDILISGINEMANDFMYMNVEEEPIVAVIKGGSMQTVPSGEIVNLDGSLSYDPAIISSEDPQGLTYQWSCFELSTTDGINRYMTSYSDDTSYRSFPPCPSLSGHPSDGSMLTIHSSTLASDRWTLVELTVRKGSREAWTTQVVRIVNNEQPTVTIVCFWNCGPKLVTGDRTVLRVDVICPTCVKVEVEDAIYKWSLYEIDLSTGVQTLIPASEWPDEIDSEETSTEYNSRGGWWKEARAYKVTVDVDISPRPPGTGEITLYTNLDPYGGSCGVSPLQGIAGLTDFRFTALDWKDEGSRAYRDILNDLNPILTYTFNQKATINTPFIYSGGEISTPPKKLVACGTPTNECDVVVHVMDPYSAITECTMRVLVTEQINLTSVESDDQVGEANGVIDTLNLQMDDTLKKKDPVKIAQDAATYGSILKSMSDAIETEEQYTEIDARTLDSEDGISGLFEVDTAKEPLKDTLAEAGNVFILDTNTALNNAIHRNDVQDAGQVQVFTKSLTSSMESGEKYITGPTITVAAGSVKNLSHILSQELKPTRVARNIDSALDSIGEFMETIVEAMAIDAATLESTPDQLGHETGLTDREIKYTADMLAKRRKFKQRSRLDEAPKIVSTSRQIWDNMFHVTRDLKDHQGSYKITKENVQMALQKTSRKQISRAVQAFGEIEDVLSFSLDDVDIDDEHADVNIQVVKTKNIFSYGKHSKYITSDVVIASMETRNNVKLPMKGPAVRHRIHDQCETNETLEMIQPQFIDGDAAQMFYHEFEYSNPQAKVCLSIRPTNDAVVYRLYVKIGSEPNDLNYDYRVTIAKHLTKVCEELCIPAGKLKSAGTAYIGLRPLLYTRLATGRRKRSVSPVIDPLAAPYMYGMNVVACYSWDDQVVDWIASKCEMYRNGSEVICRCDSSKELISGLYFQHVPNRIHFGTVFSKFDLENQAAVLGTLIGLYLLFILLALWAHYMDRRSILKWGVFPLQDNYAEDEYFYMITVYTGLRKGAGTTSNIGFSLCGDMGETGVRALTDGVREGMPAGSVVHLVMAVPTDLGPLHHLRIWHDNSGTGGGGSWYLDKVVILDLQNGDSFQFYNQRWLRPEENSLDVLVVVSSPEEVKMFEKSFFSTASKQVTDDHMWLSVFIRPERSRFNRLERVGCCLAFLLLSMIASAMFYQGAEGNDREQPKPDLQVGALRMSWQQMYYSLIAAVITSVPIFIVIVIFRRARFRVEEKVGSESLGQERKSSKTQNIDENTETDLNTPESDLTTSQSNLGNSPVTSQSNLDDSIATSMVDLENGLSPSHSNLNNVTVNSQRSSKESRGQNESEKNMVACFHGSSTEKRVNFGEKGSAKVENGMKRVEAQIQENGTNQSKEIDGHGRNNDSAHNPTGMADEDSAHVSLNNCCAKAPWMRKLEEEIKRLNKILLIRPAGRQSLDGSWPFVTRFLAWGLIFACVLVCSFFVVLYSMQWGKDVTEEWLSTFFLAFLQSLVVVDPTKVVLITFLFTIFVRSSQFVGMREINMKIVTEVNKEYGIQEKTNPPRKKVTPNAAFDTEELHESILKRKVRVLVRHTLMELGIHALLLTLVGSLCFTTRTTLDYRMQETVHNSLIGSKYSGFKYVNSTKMYYDWLENVVTPWLFPKKDYKGNYIVSQDRQYTADWSLYRLGAPRLRQVRMPMKDCVTKKIRSIPCVDGYSMGEEVTAEYCFGWHRPLPCPAIDQLRVTAGSWYFRSASHIWGMPVSGHQATYGGGGYLTNLDINALVANAIIKETKNSFWIDRQTRAVFLEFTLYSPNTDRFITVLLLAEFLPSGGVITYHAVHPFAPYPPRGSLGQYISVCEICAILLTAVGFVYIVHEFKVHRKAALCNFWFMIDVLVFLMASTAISMYSMRFSALKIALKKMRDDPTQFVNFENVIIWDTGFTSCLGFLIALTSFRLLKLAGYSKRTMRVYQVLRLSLGVLPSFMACMWIMLSSFAITGYVLFQATSPFYKTYSESVFTLFLGVLGKTGFKNTGLPPGGFHITFFYIILFGCIVNIFLANWFIAVLLEILTVSAQRDCPAVRGESAKVMQLLWESFVYLFSKKHPPFETLRENAKKSDDDEMAKVTEEFEDWILRLNLKQNPRKNNKLVTSVAVYNKASKSSKNTRHLRKRITKLSSIVNTGFIRNDNRQGPVSDSNARVEDEKEKHSKSDASLEGLGKRTDTLLDSLFNANTKIGVWHEKA